MAHHKRRRPKNRRAGCLLCKPWKVNGFARRSRGDGQKFSDFRRHLQSDPRFLARIEAARGSLRAGRGVPLEDVPG